jgi:hypothetical protein
MLLQALLLLPLAGLALRLFGFRRSYVALGRLAPSPDRRPGEGAAVLCQAQATAHLVQRAAPHRPLRSTCLTRSLTLWWLLRRQGIASDLRLGVSRAGDQLRAHAWVEYRGSVLNDAEDVRKRFAAFDGAPLPAEVWRHPNVWTGRS